MFICDQEVKDVLEKWADTEGRTLSNLVERIVQNAVAQYPNVTTDPLPSTEKTSTDKDSKNLTNKSDRLSDANCVAVAREIGIPEELALKLCDRLLDVEKD